MNGKVIAVAVVAVLLVAGGVGTYFLLKDDGYEASYDGASYNIVGRVNSEGSGLYVKNSVAAEVGGQMVNKSNNVPFFGDGFSLSKDNKDAWGGLVFADPGAASIQHTQMAQIADEVGLKFKALEAGESKNADTLYYITNISSASIVETRKAEIDGGIIWEPQFQKIIQEQTATFTTLALTNDVFDGHTCCIVAANHDWAGNNSDTLVKFLAGYTEAVNFINNAKANPTGADYAYLVEFAKGITAGLSDAEVRAALSTVTYVAADDDDGSLGDLTDDIKNLSSDLKDLGLITSDKFKEPENFAKAIVDDKYMKDAMGGKASKEGTATVDVAVISGDIHQLAIHVAKDKGYFEKYGLTVNLSTGSNGNEVADLLISKDVNMGFLGAPPATLKTINGDHIIIK